MHCLKYTSHLYQCFEGVNGKTCQFENLGKIRWLPSLMSVSNSVFLWFYMFCNAKQIHTGYRISRDAHKVRLLLLLHIHLHVRVQMFNVLIVMILLTLDLYFIEKIKPKDNSLNRLVSAFYFKKQQDTPIRSKIIY